MEGIKRKEWISKGCTGPLGNYVAGRLGQDLYIVFGVVGHYDASLGVHADARISKVSVRDCGSSLIEVSACCGTFQPRLWQ